MRYLIVSPIDNRVMCVGTSIRYNDFNYPKVTAIDGFEIGFACAVDIVEVSDEAIPEDYANDKYLYIDGEFSLNPDYSDGPPPSPHGNGIPIQEIEEAYIEGVNSIDDE